MHSGRGREDTKASRGERPLLTSLRSFLANRGESGATAVEYSLLAAAVAAVIVVVVMVLGSQTKGSFCTAADAFGQTGEVNSDVSSACP